jgi:hypothetical protein
MLVVPCRGGQTGAGEAAGVAAARKRQESVKTLDIRFQLAEVIARGGDTRWRVFPREPTTLVPAKETALESVNRLVVDGEKVRYECNHPWYGPRGELWARSSLSVFNGSTATRFFPTGLGGEGGPAGVIREDPRLPFVASQVEVVPLGLAFRGLGSLLTSNVFSEMEPSGTSLPIDGEPCEEHVLNRPDALTSYWLDPSKGYVVRRVSRQRPGGPLDQMDIRYRRDDVAGWVPVSWSRAQSLPDGTVLRTAKVDVLEMRLNNSPAAELFDIQFPIGTHVRDQRDRKNYRVQPDGSLREISPGGTDLAVPDIPPAAPQVGWTEWLLGGVGVVVWAVILAYVWRRKRGTNSASP